MGEAEGSEPFLAADHPGPRFGDTGWKMEIDV